LLQFSSDLTVQFTQNSIEASTLFCWALYVSYVY